METITTLERQPTSAAPTQRMTAGRTREGPPVRELAPRTDPRPEPEPAGLIHEVAVFGLLAVSAVFLGLALAQVSILAGLAGVVAYLTAAFLDQRLERRQPVPVRAERR